MTTKPLPLSQYAIRPGKVTIRQEEAHAGLPPDTRWTLNDWRTIRGWRNDLYAGTFQECLDHLRKIEAREMAERVTMGPAS